MFIRIAILIVLGLALLFVHRLPYPNAPKWKGLVLFDAPIRDLVRLESPRARHLVMRISDVLYIGTIVVVLAADALRGMAMIITDLQSLVVAGLLALSVERITARTRPDGTNHVSFFSGHTAATATMAGLVMFHNQRRAGVDARIFVVVGIAIAAATGLARLMSDRHWASDILAAFLVGGCSGYGLPLLLQCG